MKLKLFFKISYTAILFTLCMSSVNGSDKKFVKIKELFATEARQGIAVDSSCIYVVGTKEIGKYDKFTGELVAKWAAGKDDKIIHLDSGVIENGRLYCAHSNYPDVPMTSSVEIWDANTLNHIGTHSFGIQWGSCTWIDWYEGYWWAGFANYGKWSELTGTDERWTTIVKFNKEWQALESWIFPVEVSQKFIPMSNSGGSWGPDGLLYCTGHDGAEVYVMKIPKAGSVLELVEILPIEINGQGIAWDRSAPNYIYGIIKKDRKVIVSELRSN